MRVRAKGVRAYLGRLLAPLLFLLAALVAVGLGEVVDLADEQVLATLGLDDRTLMQETSPRDENCVPLPRQLPGLPSRCLSSSSESTEGS